MTDRPDIDASAPSEATGPAETDAAGTTRAAERSSMLLLATLTGPMLAEPVKARVRNLSDGGMMVELATVLERGAIVTVSLPRLGERTATVAWVSQGRAGFKFDDDVDAAKARRPIGGGDGSPVYAKALTVGPRRLRPR